MMNAPDTDYERISGRARTTVIYDWYRRRPVQAQLVDIGRCDTVQPDPDAQLTPEFWEDTTPQGKAAQHLERLRAHMAEHGAMTHEEMAVLLGIQRGAMRMLVHKHSALFVRDGKGPGGVKLWRLR